MLIPLGFFGGGVGNWATFLSSATQNFLIDVAVDSTGNVYSVGRFGPQDATARAYIIKQDKSGVVQWQRQLSSTYQAEAVRISSTGLIYVLSSTSSGTNTNAALFGINPDGTLSFQNNVSTGGLGPFYLKDMFLDPSDNVFFSGYNGTVAFVTKLNSAGVVQFTRTLAVNGSAGVGALVVNAAGDIYGIVQEDLTSSVVKLNSSGANVWRRSFGSGGTTGVSSVKQGITLDSAGNVYFIRNHFSSPTTYGAIISLDSSGNTLWQRRITGTYFYDLTIDESNNVYASGSGLIVKYNSSGTLQWQRAMSDVDGQGFELYSLVYDARGRLTTTGTVGTFASTNFTVESNGGGAATFPFYNRFGTTTWTYGAASFVETTTTITAGTSAFTNASRTFTNTTSSRTSTAVDATPLIKAF